MSQHVETCMGKDKLTKVIAKRLASRLRQRDKGKISAYLCGVCGSWHVGSR